MPVPKSERPSQLSDRNSDADHKLPQRFDALNQAILEAEDYLRSMKPIDPVWIDFRTYDVGDGATLHGSVTESIGFSKLKGKWRIVYRSQADYLDPDEISFYPLTDRPIETRVLAAHHIPELREKIVESKEEFISKVDESISILKSMTRGK